MNFQKKILIEHAVKYILTFVIAAILWSPIKQGLFSSVSSGKLEAIAVIMGIISLCSLTGYFSFSYTTVGKTSKQRFFGYISTFFLGTSLLLSLLIIYFISVIWVPEMQLIWLICVGSLYIGTVIFDNLDLLRMGMDVAATDFFERGITGGNDSISNAIQQLSQGHRLDQANFIIGMALVELGKKKQDAALEKTGKWTITNSHKSQHEIDKRIAQCFAMYAKGNKPLQSIVSDLKKGQNQNIADALIAKGLSTLNKDQ